VPTIPKPPQTRAADDEKKRDGDNDRNVDLRGAFPDIRRFPKGWIVIHGGDGETITDEARPRMRAAVPSLGRRWAVSRGLGVHRGSRRRFHLRAEAPEKPPGSEQGGTKIEGKGTHARRGKIVAGITEKYRDA
jgi:hypothetical protein